MSMVLFNNGRLMTDSFVMVTDSSSGTPSKSEICEKVYRDEGNHIVIACVGVQRESKDHEKTLSVVRQLLANLKAIETGVAVLEDFALQPYYPSYGAPNFGGSYVWSEAILLTSSNAYIVMNDRLCALASNETRLGVNPGVYSHLRNAGKSPEEALELLVKHSSNAAFPINVYDQKTLMSLSN